LTATHRTPRSNKDDAHQDLFDSREPKNQEDGTLNLMLIQKQKRAYAADRFFIGMPE